MILILVLLGFSISLAIGKIMRPPQFILREPPQWMQKEARAWAPWTLKTPVISIIILKGPDLFPGGKLFSFNMRMGVLTCIMTALVATTGVASVGGGVAQAGDGVASVGDGVAQAGASIKTGLEAIGLGLGTIGLGLGAVGISIANKK